MTKAQLDTVGSRVPPASDYPKPSAIRRRSGIAQISANLIGAVLCTVYFTFLDPPQTLPQVDEILIFSLALSLAFVAIGSLYSVWWQRDILTYFGFLHAGKNTPAGLRARVQKKILNAPFFGAALSMSIWVFAAIVMACFRFNMPEEILGGSSSLHNAFRVFVGTMSSGIAASAIVFLSFEAISRPLLPLVFPEGGLTATKGVLRVTLRWRLLVSFFLVGVGPMVLAGLIFYHKAASLAQGHGDNLASIVYVILFIVLTSVGLAFVLSRLVSSSVVGPVGQMQKATARVKEGDLSGEIPVTSNDELGALGESFNLMVEGLRERRLLKETFGKYVSREIRDEIMAGRIALDGESKEVTLLFSDLRDFTPLVEATPPKTVVKIINDYFQEMSQAVQNQSGLVLQFVGDEIESVFGAPLALENHASRAVAAALEMRARLEALNQRLEAQGHKPLRHGIGIHTGTVLAGNIGSSDRLSYALVGDTVNLASRIQELNKQFGSDILISQATKRALRQAPDLREMPPAEVKGKSQPVQVYAVL